MLAALAYAPLLAVRPGVVTPDTKTYLYLDPTRFLSQVAFMWDPTVALGTVSHEYIGYLLPMGPFFAVFHLVGVPVWVAQRLWLGSILFAAGLGVLYLSRILGLRGPGPAAAALAYMLSPYFLQYAGRISVILLPWAGLPFMLGLTIVALRRGGWREPALFAVVVALVSGINASSIIYVGVAPILWLLYAVVVLRESTWRHALGTGLRIGILTLGRVPVVDGGPRGGGGLRRQRPEVHRDRPLDVGHLEPGRHHPRPRLLVLLRQPTTPARGPTRPSATPRTSPCWRPPTRCRWSPWWRRRSCAGASAPSSSSSSSSAWCSRWGRSRSPTRR